MSISLSNRAELPFIKQGIIIKHLARLDVGIGIAMILSISLTTLFWVHSGDHAGFW